MEKVKYLILGAGPAGLTFANRLKDRGEDSFLVIEKEAQAGGLCRSREVDGAPLDIGGGHFLDVRRPAVNEFLFRFMPREEWDLYTRDSRIRVEGNEVHHPIEANIWEMDVDSQVAYLASIAQAGCIQGMEEPVKFVDWIYWKLGKKIADSYMIPYNQKMFSKELNELGTYWLDKLPNVSFEDTLRSCLCRQAYAKQPGHAQFYYPKHYGYGELWLRLAAALEDRLLCGQAAVRLDADKKQVTLEDGRQLKAQIIISTVPWTSFQAIEGISETARKGIGRLRHSATEIAYYPENMDTKAHWIYYPDPALSYHRILVRHNFCPGSKGYWTETNSERIHMERRQPSFAYCNAYAYPLNTVEKPRIMRELLAEMAENGIYGLGRWGEWEHYNSDTTVERAMRLAERV